MTAQSNGAFIENRGQWDGVAQYLMTEPGLNFWVTQAGPVLDFYRTVAATKTSKKQVQGDVVRMSFVGAKQSAFEGSKQVEGNFNYFIGNDQTKWASNVRRFAQVNTSEIYDGVSVQYSVQNGAPRYDLVLKPGSDVSQIGLKIEGVSDAKVLENGDLQLETSLGKVVETGMAAFQQEGAAQVRVPCKMALDGNVLKFDVGSYDTSKTLIIDPLVYSTYFAPLSESTVIKAVALDKASNVVITGENKSGELPITTGAYQTTLPSGTPAVAFLGKLYPELNKMVFCTYFGAKDGETEATDVAIGGTTGDPVIVGATNCVSLPVSSTAYQKTNRDSTGGYNAFITKFNATGTALVFSTYLGGSGNLYYMPGDFAECVKLDATEEPVVAGETPSTDFPVSSTAYQKVLKAYLGGNNIFVTKLNATGSALVFSTLFGGTGNYDPNSAQWQAETVSGLALDTSYNPVFCGSTFSADLPLSSTAYQKVNLEFPNAATGYVAKLSSTGAALVFSTYLGGTGSSQGGSLDANNTWSGDDATGLVLLSGVVPVVCGATGSDNFPVTAGAYQTTNRAAHDGGANGFITELNSAGTGVNWSTYLGGTINDGASGIALNGTNIVVVGGALSADYPVTSGAFQTKLNGTLNVVVSELNSTGTSLLYSTYLGGNASDAAYDVAVNPSGLAYVVGSTDSGDYPTTSGSIYPVYAPVVSTQYEPGFLSALEFPATAIVLSNFTIGPSPIHGGNGTIGHVFLSNSMASNATVTLKATGPVTFQASVVVPAGFTTADFTISTKGVASATSVVFTATYGTKSLTSTLVVDPPVVAVLASSVETANSGQSFTCYVILQGVAGPAGTVVSLASGDTDTSEPAHPFTVPATVTVPAGKTIVSFTAKATATTTGVYSGYIKATLAGESQELDLDIDPS